MWKRQENGESSGKRSTTSLSNENWAICLYEYVQYIFPKEGDFENGRFILRLTGWLGWSINHQRRAALAWPAGRVWSFPAESERPRALSDPRPSSPPVRVSGTRHWTYYVAIHTPACLSACIFTSRKRHTSGLMEVRCTNITQSEPMDAVVCSENEQLFSGKHFANHMLAKSKVTTFLMEVTFF